MAWTHRALAGVGQQQKTTSMRIIGSASYATTATLNQSWTRDIGRTRAQWIESLVFKVAIPERAPNRLLERIYKSRARSQGVPGHNRWCQWRAVFSAVQALTQLGVLAASLALDLSGGVIDGQEGLIWHNTARENRHRRCSRLEWRSWLNLGHATNFYGDRSARYQASL